MKLSLLSVLAVMLMSFVAAQQTSISVTQLFIPFADQQPLDASLINQHDQVATLAVQCAPGTSAENCGLPLPVTITAGPSTFHFSGTGTYTILGDIDCEITGSTAANCVAVQGVYDTGSIATATDSDWVTKTASSTITTSGVLSGSEVAFVAVTITAGLNNVNGTGSSSSSRSGTVTKSNGGSKSNSTSGSLRATATTATKNGITASVTQPSNLLVALVLFSLMVGM